MLVLVMSYCRASLPPAFNLSSRDITEGGLNTSALISGGKINQLDADWIAWKAWIQASGTPLLIESKAQYDLVTFLSCELVGRTHRKARKKVSYAPAV